MKKRYISLLVMIMGVYSVCSTEQELITSPKNKKKFVSEQQCIELETDMVIATNAFQQTINAFQQTTNAFQQTTNTLQKESLSVLTNYADGEKDCFLKQASKAERTDYYEKKMKKLHAVERCNDEIQKMQQRLNGFMELLS